MSGVEVSVIVPTYNGAHKIGGLLAALSRQTFAGFETVVVVDGSRDDTAGVVRTWIKNPDRIRLIEQPNAGRSGARNRGVAEAHGSLLIFFDDDVLPSPDSVQRHVDFHAEHQKSILTGNAPQALRPDETDFQRYRRELTVRWIATFPHQPVLLTAENLFLTAANCSMRKELFEQLDGFLQRLADAEDREFGIRAFRSGISVFFDRENNADHEEKLTCQAYIRRLRQYAVANKAVDEMHPDLAKKIKSISLTKRLVYRLLASRGWVALIDHSNVLLILPISLRYTLYDAVTFALSEVYPETPL